MHTEHILGRKWAVKITLDYLNIHAKFIVNGAEKSILYEWVSVCLWTCNDNRAKLYLYETDCFVDIHRQKM